jgi:hypothetical protein
VHEERLSPELGRLIDAAKDAATRVDPTKAGTEVVGVLVSTGAVYAAHADEDQSGSRLSAVESVLALALAEGQDEVLAAVVALAHDTSESVSPSPATCSCLAEVDPELPVVLKQRGRWVMLPLSQIRSSV